MILLFSLLLYLLVQKWKWCLWLVLPLSIFIDLWRMDKLGISGLKILVIISLLGFVFGTGIKENQRLRISEW